MLDHLLLKGKLKNKVRTNATKKFSSTLGSLATSCVNSIVCYLS